MTGRFGIRWRAVMVAVERARQLAGRRGHRRADQCNHDEQRHNAGTHHVYSTAPRRALGTREHALMRALYSVVRRSRNAFAITDTELNVIAALATTGLSSRPDTGYSTPAASGTPSRL